MPYNKMVLVHECAVCVSGCDTLLFDETERIGKACGSGVQPRTELTTKLQHILQETADGMEENEDKWGEREGGREGGRKRGREEEREGERERVSVPCLNVPQW